MKESEIMQDDEISLRDLVDMLAGGWKIWVATSVVGVAVGFGAWSMQGFKAELVANLRGGLDMMTWNGYAASLPALAEQRLEAASDSAEHTRVLRAMAQPAWWKANVTPGYLLTKGDVKDLASVSKEILDAGATSILRLTVRASGVDQASARRDALFIENFLRDGALYLALKAIVSRYEMEVGTQPVDLRQKMTTSERELYFLNQRAVELESLRKQFPDQRNEPIMAQFLDPKDTGAKYLPVPTQIVAVKTDINGVKESIARNKLRLDELAVYRKFVGGASPLLAKTDNGFKLAEALVANEKALRNALDPADAAGRLAVDTIARDLESAVVKVGGMFEAEPLVLIVRPKLPLPLALGLLGGVLAGVLWVFVADGWRRTRERRRAES